MAEQPKDPLLHLVARDVRHLAALIDAPGYLLPTYVVSDESGRPHLEREGPDLCYVVRERGQELDRRRTRSRDELLYWIFRDVTFTMASMWEAAHRVPDEDFRRGLFTRQLELLESIDQGWAHRYRQEKAHRLREVGLG